jgi:hypothetical protein
VCLRAVAVVSIMAGLTLSGCGHDRTAPPEAGVSTEHRSEETMTGPTSACETSGTTSGTTTCAALALRFTKALTLEEVERVASDEGGSLLALWRPDAVCVGDVRGQGPSPFPGAAGQRRSSFSYYRADAIVARQNEGPPPTDGGWSQALRLRFLEEWQAARASGVAFIGAALYLPDGSARARPGIEIAGDLESYRVEATGVVYLRGHEAALGAMFAPPDGPPC